MKIEKGLKSKNQIYTYSIKILNFPNNPRTPSNENLAFFTRFTTGSHPSNTAWLRSQPVRSTCRKEHRKKFVFLIFVS